MEIVLPVVFLAGITGAALGRLTPLHPLVAGIVVGLFGAALTLLALAGFMGDGTLAMAAVGGVVTGLAGALGAFLGWLRRVHVGRSR